MTRVSSNDKEERLAILIKSLISELVGPDEMRHNPGLGKTPIRYAKALLRLTQGYTENLSDLINGAIFETNASHIVIVRDIAIESLCEHHLLPFIGKVHIAYKPNGRIVGLSKLARIATHFARRLQVQERLTHQIAWTLSESLDALGVLVVIEAAHMCMSMRGVEQRSTSTTTLTSIGCFEDPQEQANALALLHIQRS